GVVVEQGRLQELVEHTQHQAALFLLCIETLRRGEASIVILFAIAHRALQRRDRRLEIIEKSRRHPVRDESVLVNPRGVRHRVGAGDERFAAYRGLWHLQCGELRRRAEILSCNERDGLHPFSAKLHAELVLLRGLTFDATIIRVLIVRVVAEACDDGIEAFASGGEIDNRGEYGGILVEKELHALQRGEYCVL